MPGGSPRGCAAGHVMASARLRILQLLQEDPQVLATVANDFTDIPRWLPDSRLLITYVAGPHPNEEQNQVIRQWLEAGGRWLAPHRTRGGGAVAGGGQRHARQKGKARHPAPPRPFFPHPPAAAEVPGPGH